MPALRPTIAALAVALLTVLAGLAPAQGPAAPKDDDLDKFLQNIDAPKSSREKEKPAPKPAGGLSTKDKDLDGFLEKLGETKDAPAAEDPPRGPAGAKPAPKPEPKTEALKKQDQTIDQRLEELLGRKPKRKGGGDDGAGPGPLGDVVKQMREIEERLGKPDTGDETRKKQEQVVKRLEQVIEQMRSMQPSGKKKMQLVMQKGQKPGQDQPGPRPGTTGGNAPHQRPLTPDLKNKRSLAGGKDEWGHLPPELRQEMDNVFKEEGLPAREELIRRYYLSLSKKVLIREE